MYELDALERWILNFVTFFRSRIQDLTEKEQELILDHFDLTAKCQIKVLLLSNESYNMQVFLCLKDSNLPDLKIDIYGVYELSSENKERVKIKEIDFNKIEEFLENTHFTSNFIEEIENEILQNIGTMNYGGTTEKINTIIRNENEYKAYLWVWHGDIQNTKYSSIASTLIKDIEVLNETELLDVTSYTGYILPPVWIGEIPKIDFLNKINGKGRIENCIKELNTFIYKNTTIKVESDGFLIIYEKDKHLALKLINEILSVLLIYNKNISQMNYNELIHTIKNTENQIRPIYSIIGLELSGDRCDYFNKRYFDYRIKISEEEFFNSVEQAKELLKIEKIAQMLEILLHSRTNLNNFQYSQSFILSWTIIEQIVNDIWNKFIESLKLFGKRKKKLVKDHRYLTLDHKLEMLNINNRINNREYLVIMDLKNLRNKFIHELRHLEKTNAEECFNFCRNLLQKYISEQ